MEHIIKAHLLILLVCMLAFGCGKHCDETKSYGGSYNLTHIYYNQIARYDWPTHNSVNFSFDSIRMFEPNDTVIFFISTDFLDVNWEKEMECENQDGYAAYNLAGDKFRIETVGDFDNVHPNGSDVSDCFVYTKDYLNYVRMDSLVLSNLQAGSSNQTYLFCLIKKPKPGFLRFKIHNFTSYSGNRISGSGPLLHFY